MLLHTQSRATRKKREDFYARADRRYARREAKEIESYRGWCDLNFFRA